MTTKSARSLFLDAVELPPERWSEYLDDVCEGDLELHQKIVRLLAAHQQVTGFMNQPAVEGAATLEQSREKIGAQIGPYELKEQIGEGGMGIVYVAEQREPIRRFVALKVIKPGMDTKQVVARFEAERQTLAILDHPHIARVIDAGTTDQGRPYFVMELVRGVPITEFCDEERLPIRERLKLFCQVCEAVQHAHQKGIIHRDLKPSNVLVMRTDDQPIPKVIDFGIAKAVNQPLTEKTIYSQFGHVMGTPLYMSPEQAQLTGLDIDTRSDVYSLGVLLYELLTGTTPFASEVLRDKGLDEFRRLVREEEPAHPSHRISTLAAEAGSTISAKRGIDPRRLRQLMRGELDWIALRCLEKDRNRRYQSANELADDVQRYLDDKAVEASPPSSWYRLRKFANRNRGALAATAIVCVALLAGTGVSLWQVQVANAASKLAGERLQTVTTEKKNAKQSAADMRAVLEFFENRVLAAPRPDDNKWGLGINVTIRDAIAAAEPDIAAQFANRPLVEASLRSTIGRTYASVGEPKRAIEQFERARELKTQVLGPHDIDTLKQSSSLGIVLQNAGRTDEAEVLLRETLSKMAVHLGPNHQDSLEAEGNLVLIKLQRGDTAEGTRMLENIRQRSEDHLALDHDTTFGVMRWLANAYEVAEKPDVALSLVDLEFSRMKAKHGADHLDSLTSANRLGRAYVNIGRPAEGQALLESILPISEAKRGPKHSGTLAIKSNLAMAYWSQGNLELAIPMMKSVHEGLKPLLAPDHPDRQVVLNNLMTFYFDYGQYESALALARERVAQGKIDWHMLNYWLSVIQFGFILDPVELEPLWKEIFPVALQDLGADHQVTKRCIQQLERCYEHLKRPRKIAILRRELVTWWEAHKPDSLGHASAAYNLAKSLFQQSRAEEARAPAEQAWEIFKATRPDHWQTFEAESLLGACLLAQQDYNAARPRLQSGYRGMWARKAQFDQTLMAEPLDRIAQLCEETEQMEDAVRNRYYAEEHRLWKPAAAPPTKEQLQKFLRQILPTSRQSP